MFKHSITAKFSLRGLSPELNVGFERTFEETWATAEHAKQRAESKLNTFLQKWRASGWTMLGDVMIFYHNLCIVTPVHTATEEKPKVEEPKPVYPYFFIDPTDDTRYSKAYVNRGGFYDSYVEIVDGKFKVIFEETTPHTKEGLKAWEEVVLKDVMTPGYVFSHPACGLRPLKVYTHTDKPVPYPHFEDPYGRRVSVAQVQGHLCHRRLLDMVIDVTIDAYGHRQPAVRKEDQEALHELNIDVMTWAMKNYVNGPNASFYAPMPVYTTARDKGNVIPVTVKTS